MADLPFLVVHGSLVWKVGAVATAAAGVRVGGWMRDRGTSKFVRRATKHYTATATGLEAGPILVRGHLRGGGAQSYEHGLHPIVHTRDAGAYVDIEGERIDFTGEVVVGCGSENRTSYWRAPAGTLATAGAEQHGRGPQRLSIVREGDEVLVAGVLRRAAAGDADYRDSAGGWMIEPFPRQGAIGLVAQRHRARALPRTPIGLGITFGVCALLALAGMRTCGAIDSSPYGYNDSAIHELTVASAMPGTREDALADLDNVLLNARSEDHLQQAFALRELRHGCKASIDLMIQESHPDDALAAARRCNEPERELTALVLLGRYDDAARSLALPSADRETREVVALATGHWADAARAEPDLCTQVFYEALAGGHTPPDLHPRCSLLASQLLPPDQRAGAAASITPATDDDARLADALVDLDLKHATDHAGDLEDAGRELLVGDAADPAPRVFTSRPGDLTAMRAVYETYAGDYDKAAEIAGTLIARATTESDTVRARRLAALIAMRAGRPVAPEWLANEDQLPTGSVYRGEELGTAFAIARGGDGVYLPHSSYALTEAMQGDGTHLSDAWNGDELSLKDGMTMIAVLPRIVTARAHANAYADALHSEPMTMTRTPMRWVRAAAMHRDVARAAGDAYAAGTWQATIDRQLQVLAQRDRLLGFVARSAP